MSAPLDWIVDEGEQYAVVTVHGRLDMPGASRLRQTLMKCLAEQPGALLVDLSDMQDAGATSLSVFTAVARQAATWPGTAVLLCAPPEVAARLQGGRYGVLAVHSSLDAARLAIAEGPPVTQRVIDHLLPVTGAVRHARDLATDACAKWGLPHLVGPACLIVSELVTNAVEHAGTMIVLELRHRDRKVHIAVRDGSPEMPRMIPQAPADRERGRGMLLIDNIATSWGALPSRDGKVVWATLTA
ncbi:ATP-binding protein [Krasilnikovia sp. MM14-A1259]|uniref:ATP-binding protein n=1 Tax=Krasilnikovia sp. MM14-A1259 TaxID=3373539 RepID=UPI003810CF70